MSTGGNLLVIGGAGFIGSNFTIHALDHFDSVTVLDTLSYAGSRRNLEPVASQIDFIEGDLRDREQLDELYPSIDWVINFAAQSHVDRSITDGRVFVQSNIEGAFTAMDALRDHSIERFVQISTDEVYGSIEHGAVDETAPLDPSSPYSASKASADMFVNSMWVTYGLPITIVRPTNVYGPRQHPEKFIPKFTLRALAGRSLPLYGDGSHVRQWLYVNDLCSALFTFLEEGTNEIFNIGGGTHKQNFEVANSILELVGNPEAEIEHVEDRPGHDQRYALDDTKARSKFDLGPDTDFEVGLERTVEWYRSNWARYAG